MKVSDEIKIENSVGVLRVKLLQKLNTLDVIKGNCQILPTFINLRWECHRSPDGDCVVMISEKDEKHNCYLAIIDDSGVEYWKGDFSGGETAEKIYTLLEK